VSGAAKTILIASSTFDEHTHGLVRRLLEQAGRRVVLWLTDRVLAGRERFELELGADGALRMSYEGRPMGPEAVDAAWYWEVAGLRVADAEDNVAKQLSLVNEMTQWNAAIWGLYPEGLWLNSPAASAHADRKLEQR
jgi:hypothetical protein